jgi:hypothetical protein
MRRMWQACRCDRRLQASNGVCISWHGRWRQVVAARVAASDLNEPEHPDRLDFALLVRLTTGVPASGACGSTLLPMHRCHGSVLGDVRSRCAHFILNPHVLTTLSLNRWTSCVPL